MLKNTIVVTTIHPPTKGIELLAQIPEHDVIIIGDKKTPANWHYSNTLFLSVEQQLELDYQLVEHLPFNHYARKMIGYLYAIEHGALTIFDTDDDNLPKPSWQSLPSEGTFSTSNSQPFVNVYQHFTSQQIWPRGYPLNLLNQAPTRQPLRLEKKEVRVGIWQGLADGDPDVDAIYRLTNNTPCYFDEKEPLVLGKGSICPFNSQNTIFCESELFPLLYLPAYVTFRFTDILRGLVAQPIMWAHNYLLGFTNATVVQERNPHDYLKDFESEIPCYLHVEKVVEIAKSTVLARRSVADNLYEVYCALHQHNIVVQKELELLRCWLTDLSRL